VTKPIEGVYPNWKQVVPSERGPSRIILGEPGIKTILEALPLLPGGEHINQPVCLEITGDDLALKARMSEKDHWNCIPIPAGVSGPSVAISLNRNYLAKALRFGCTEIAIEDRLSPLVFSTKGKTMVVMPLKPDASVATPGTQPTNGQPPVTESATAQAPASQPENASAAATPPAATTPPVQQTASQPPEPLTERNEMPRTARTTAPETNTRGSLTNELHNNGSNNGNGTNSPVKPLVDQVEGIKDNLKGVIRDLSTVVDGLKQAEKDQRATEKEVESARATLKKLQQVTF
jgi:hypothetical protein